MWRRILAAAVFGTALLVPVQNANAAAVDANGDGLAVEVIGDLETADRVAVLVPGVGTTLANFSDGLGGVARRAPAVQAQHLAAAVRTADPGARVAVVAWLGYDPPDGLGLDAVRRDRAAVGARALSQFVDGLTATRPGVRVILVGYSYGAVVLGLAAPHLDGRVSDLVAFGAPGMGVTRVDDLRTGARVWAARRPVTGSAGCRSPDFQPRPWHPAGGTGVRSPADAGYRGRRTRRLPGPGHGDATTAVASVATSAALPPARADRTTRRSRPSGRAGRTTPAVAGTGRDRGVDALRALAIVGVVLGHWLVTALVVRPDGTLRTASPLATLTGLAPISWLLQTLALFFFAAGFAAATPRPAPPGRARRAPAGGTAAGCDGLGRPAAAFLALWALAALLGRWRAR